MYDCLACISEFIVAKNKWIESGQPEGSEPMYHEMVTVAITLAPAWQQNAIMNQMIATCVAVPSCLHHLGVHEKTPMERAAGSGLVIPSSVQR